MVFMMKMTNVLLSQGSPVTRVARFPILIMMASMMKMISAKMYLVWPATRVARFLTRMETG
jgi:hypothetical protein